MVGRTGLSSVGGGSVGSAVGNCGVRIMMTGKVGVGNRIGARVGRVVDVGRTFVAVGVGVGVSVAG